MEEQHINNGKLPDELVSEHEKTHTRMLFSSAVFRVKRTKTVWTKYETTEEWTNRETRHCCIASHSPTISSLPSCVAFYATVREIWCRTRGRKRTFSVFIRNKTWRFDQVSKKFCHIYLKITNFLQRKILTSKDRWWSTAGSNSYCE